MHCRRPDRPGGIVATVLDDAWLSSGIDSFRFSVVVVKVVVVLVRVRVKAPDPLHFIVWLLVRSNGPMFMNAVA